MRRILTRDRPMAWTLGGLLSLAFAAGCGGETAAPPENAPVHDVPETRPATMDSSEPSPRGPHTYYLDAEEGDDRASGRSPETAWKTLGRLNAHPLEAGDRVLLKRGGTWQDRLDLSAPEGTPAAIPVTIGAYGDGDDPVLGMVAIRRDNTILEHLTIDQNRQGWRLFSIDVRFRMDIAPDRKISTNFRNEFEKRGIAVSPEAFFRQEPGPIRWVLRDYDNERKFGIQVEDDRIDVFQTDDAVRILGARNCVLRQLAVRNGINDGIDADYADGLRIEGCHIHHLLAGSFAEQADAHGIVITRTQGATIRDTEIHHVSGDCLQTDPYRSEPITTDVIIENCHFWTSPLEDDFNDGWRAGDRPGENAIDTKGTNDARNGPRMRLAIRNVNAHGWLKDSFIANKAAFNMKEKVEAVFENVTVSECELGFRLRGTRGNANVTIMNSLVRDCECAIRVEDNLQNLKVLGTTFGPGIDRIFVDAAMDRKQRPKETWELLGNVFTRPLDAKTDRLILPGAGETGGSPADANVLPLDPSNRVTVELTAP